MNFLAGRPFVKELHVRHGKLGKTTYYARTRTWTRARTKNGRYRDTGIFFAGRPFVKELHVRHAKLGKTTY